MCWSFGTAYRAAKRKGELGPIERVIIQPPIMPPVKPLIKPPIKRTIKRTNKRANREGKLSAIDGAADRAALTEPPIASRIQDVNNMELSTPLRGRFGFFVTLPDGAMASACGTGELEEGDQ